jgi:acetoin utilization protein AcuB
MRVNEWMTVAPTTVTPATTVAGAAQMMTARGVRHLVVVQHGHVVGILSNRDVLRSDPRAPDDRRVADVMSRPVHTIGPDEPLDVAVRLLLSRHISALPVVDADDALLGIITTTDCLLAFQHQATAG